ncbi:tyrosine-protein phosphatase [Nitriliruptor alkaliphilus]|uniref:tyrosine-protein phosphatase n=1 Tax=Nitriliruptor alkaliphilus TaxID=427918 RepID=UPI0006989F54|nr:tyrosine-protein phosphatase [Nitriliruptor alkaliphilus]
MPPSTDQHETAPASDRHPGLLNHRDLGGTPTRDGRVLASGRLVRAAEPVDLSDDEVATLAALGVRSRIDLRAQDEPAQQPCTELDAAGVAVHHVPFRGLLAAERLPPLETAEQLGEYYLASARANLGALVTAVELVAGEAALATLVHCAWGKDRAGLVIATVLELVGVPREAVLADYARTQEAAPRLLDRVLARVPPERAAKIDRDRPVLHAHEVTMRTFLTAVDAEHGGVAGLLSDGGADPAGLAEALRGRLLA